MKVAESRDRVRSVAKFRVVLVASALAYFANACSSETKQAETIGVQTSALSVGTNFSLGGPSPWYSETSVASARFAGAGLAHWVVASNCLDVGALDPTGHTCPQLPGWSWSDDITGAGGTWHTSTQQHGSDFGDPGKGTYGNFLPNGQWLGDPSIIAITNPALSNNGSRLIYANIVVEDNATNTGGGNDIVVAVSDDGGKTWLHAQYANVLGVNNGGFKCGGIGNCKGGTDGPMLAANPVAPYGTWAAWSTQGVGFINWIQYGAPPNDAWSNGQVPLVIPGSSTNGIVHPIISVGTAFDCNNAPHEAVYVVYASDTPVCGPNIFSCSTTAVNWWWAVYIKDTNQWFPSATTAYPLDTDPAMPNCIADPINVTLFNNGFAEPQPTSLNQSFPAIATFYNQVVFAYPHSTSNPNVGQRIFNKSYTFNWNGTCATGGYNPMPTGTFRTPDVRGGGTSCPPGQCVGTCGTGLNDEWAPAMGFLINSGAPQLLTTWYDTRDDRSSVSHNRNVSLYGARGTSISGNAFGSVFAISRAQAGQTIPWDHTLALWRDYQGVGTDANQSGYNGTKFMSAWGGDARYGGPTGIWTASISTP